MSDPYDTMNINSHYEYTNMFKQLCNNALDFGIVQNTMWVLGYSNWVHSNGNILTSTNNNLILVCFQYIQDNISNKYIRNFTLGQCLNITCVLISKIARLV